MAENIDHQNAFDVAGVNLKESIMATNDQAPPFKFYQDSEAMQAFMLSEEIDLERWLEKQEASKLMPDISKNGEEMTARQMLHHEAKEVSSDTDNGSSSEEYSSSDQDVTSSSDSESGCRQETVMERNRRLLRELNGHRSKLDKNVWEKPRVGNQTYFSAFEDNAGYFNSSPYSYDNPNKEMLVDGDEVSPASKIGPDTASGSKDGGTGRGRGGNQDGAVKNKLFTKIGKGKGNINFGKTKADGGDGGLPPGIIEIKPTNKDIVSSFLIFK